MEKLMVRQIEINATLAELERGNSIHGDFKSLQEAFAVLDECQQQIRMIMVLTKRDEWPRSRIRKQLVKLTAMSLKALEFVSSGTGPL